MRVKVDIFPIYPFITKGFKRNNRKNRIYCLRHYKPDSEGVSDLFRVITASTWSTCTMLAVDRFSFHAVPPFQVK